MAGRSWISMAARQARAAAPLLAQLLAVLIGVIGVVGNVEAAVGLGMAMAVLTGLTGAVLANLEISQATPRTIWRLVATGQAAAAVLAGVMVLFADAAGPLVLAGLVVTGGYLTRLWRRSADGASGREPEPTRADTLTELSDAELGRAWRRSHAGLRRARDGAQLDRLYAVRRRQLDEMERRHPQGFRRWLHDGGSVSGSSAPFLEQ